MRKSQLIASIVLLLFLLAVNQAAGINSGARSGFGGLNWWGWLGLAFFIGMFNLVLVIRDAVRSSRLLEKAEREQRTAPVPRGLDAQELSELGLTAYHGPEYPHPVIFPERCIGCHACVDACPHDVLAIVDGRAAVVAIEQCMEDTSCQVECPVNPKACIVVNTTKTIKPRPAPTRDGSTYMTNVPGCYLIGDVSGVPLIKNAIKEGAEVIEHIASELGNAAPEPRAEYDVAIIGIGPGGASAAVCAQERGLRYVGIEQEKILATIEAYPKNKYIFFKPDNNDWFGGLGVLGMGLQPNQEGDAMAFKRALSTAMQAHWDEQLKELHAAIEESLPVALRADLATELDEKLNEGLGEQLTAGLLAHLTELEREMVLEEDLPRLFDEKILTLAPESRRDFFAEARRAVWHNLTRRIAGDQRERILEVWHGTMREKGVRINEAESCKAVKPAEDGDYFLVTTEQLATNEQQTYRARRVVLAIGLRGTPRKLGVAGEDMSFTIDGREEEKVLYRLSNPGDFKRRRIVVVGGGNSAVEAAVDLVAQRVGDRLEFRPPEETNDVTLLVRSDFKTDLKFGNKLLAYQCIDAGVLNVRFRAAVKEVREREVVINDVETKQEVATIANDYIFALIGGDRPDRFIKSIGIEIRK